ncbi:unnamed protein product [Auanema sp. JU1783]|nr:unnamed protein product [Auanema sp. JU1783]
MTSKTVRTEHDYTAELTDNGITWDEDVTVELKTTVVDYESCESIDKKPVPIDKMYLVYAIIMLNGVGVLLPWNMFITIAPEYYEEYWFTYNGTESKYGKQFMTDLGIISQIPNFLLAVLSVASVIKGALFIKIGVSLGFNCLLIGVILIFAIVKTPDEKDQGWFFAVNLAIVLLMNASNGFYQNSMFGLAADFPFAYTNAVIVGSNLCGTFTSVMSILSTLIFKTAYQKVAIVYFSISLLVLILCGFSIIVMTRTEFYKYYAELGAAQRSSTNAERPSLKQFWEAFKHCWIQYLNVFLVYFVTLSIFPTVLVGSFSGDTKDVVIGLAVFLNFNLFAFFGSTAANFIQIPSSKFLFIPVFLRVLFIPFFTLCAYDSFGSPDQRVMPIAFNGSVWIIIGNCIMAITSGYFSSLGMMYAPSIAPDHLKKVAGQCAGLALVGGIMAGVAFTPVITSMVEHIH